MQLANAHRESHIRRGTNTYPALYPPNQRWPRVGELTFSGPAQLCVASNEPAGDEGASPAKACTTRGSSCLCRRVTRAQPTNHSPVLGRFGHLRHRVQLSPRVLHPPLARHDGPHLARRPLQDFAQEHVLQAEGSVGATRGRARPSGEPKHC